MSNPTKKFDKSELLDELKKIARRQEEEYEKLEKRCEQDLKSLKERMSEQAEEEDEDKDKFCKAMKEIEQIIEKQKTTLKSIQAQEKNIILEDITCRRTDSRSGKMYHQSRNSSNNPHPKNDIYVCHESDYFI